MKIAVIGGGAAGFFAAIHASGPGREVTIYEKSPKLLAKVKVSGGGRCNVTHKPLEISKLVKNYPRGEKFLKKVFPFFKSEHTIEWFENRGLKLKVEPDGRMFPITDSSQSVIDVLLKESQKLGIEIHKSCAVKAIALSATEGFVLNTDRGQIAVDKLIVATGGHPKVSGYSFLKSFNHTVLEPIPSLFTFNTPNESIRELMGLSVPDGLVRIEGTKLSYRGPILITHWGLSGPAVLKLSAFGAKWLKDQNYRAKTIINWKQGMGEQDYLDQIKSYQLAHPNRKVFRHPLFGIPSRLWEHFAIRSDISSTDLYAILSKKQINKLVQNLFCYILNIEGKTTFKEEFVSAGGISLDEINPKTMESKLHSNLYFAGEVLDIDGITGGFNFQAAWSTGYLAGKASLI